MDGLVPRPLRYPVDDLQGKCQPETRSAGRGEEPVVVPAPEAQPSPPPVEPDPSLVPFQPAAKRTLTVFGGPVELVLVPGRKLRKDVAAGDRPPFGRSPAARIVRDEAYWRGDGLALTPNRYPFAREHRILWTTQPARDPDLASPRGAAVRLLLHLFEREAVIGTLRAG